jgi:hypothetical protein
MALRIAIALGSRFFWGLAEIKTGLGRSDFGKLSDLTLADKP